VLSFTTPWALAAVTLAAWLLWRARRPQSNRTHTVSNLFLWRGGASPPATTGLPNRPRPPWLVWLQAFALVGLVIAAAGPMRRSPLSDASLVVDISRSMSARDGSGTRLDLARTAARTWLSAQRAGSRITLVTAGQRSAVVDTFRQGDTALDSALMSLTPEDAPADLGGALRIARAVTRGAVTVITDNPPPTDADRVAVEWLRVGSLLDNVGIVSLRSGGAGHALVEAQNFGASTQQVSLTLTRAGRELWRQQFTLGAGSSRAFLPAVPNDVTVVTAQLEVTDRAGDGLAADNTRTADVAPQPRVSVLLVSAGNRFLEQALRALDDVTLDVVTTLPTNTPAGTLIVCDGCTAAPPRPSLWLPPVTSRGLAGGPIAVMQGDHPLMRGIDVSDVRVTATTVPDGPWLILATATGRPIIAVDDSASGRQVVLATDLAESSLPLSVAFPVFVANAIEWLADRPSSGLSASDVLGIAESDLRQPAPTALGAVSATAVPTAGSWRTVVALMAWLLVAIEWGLRRTRPWARAAATLAIVGAIAGARVPGCATGRTVVFAVDGSGSVASARPIALDRVRAEIGAMGSNDRSGLVVFGDHGGQLRAPDADRSLVSVTLPPPAAATNLAAGIQSAQQALPVDGDRRIVLLTDGQPTTGDAMAAAAGVGVPIDVIPLDDRQAPVIRWLDAPVASRSGVAIALRAEIEGASGTRVSVDLTRDGAPIGSRTITIDSTGRASATWIDTPPHAGVVFYHATAVDPRLGIGVSSAGAGVTVGGRGRVLVVTNRPGDLAARLRSPDVEIDEQSSAAMSDTRAKLAPYSAIVLDAIGPHLLNVRQRDALSDAVAFDGAGLLVLGDRASLDAADYAPTRFTDMFPIDLATLPKPPTATSALALLVDTSGSMASTSDGITKISAARAAVSRALAVLPAGDAVQVFGFSTTPTVIVSADDRRDPAAITERLRAMAPGGGTALTPALTQAMAWLRSVAHPVRRVLVVSDGRTTAADGEAARTAVEGQDIEVSVVAIGADADRNWLMGLANSTGGRAYFPDSLQDLPRDVARAAARGNTDREVDEPFRVRSGAHPLAPASPPVLGGYVAGQLRPGAVAAWKSSTEDPVLAAWPHGLGRVAVFASDLRGPWGSPLSTWREGDRFWRRAVSWVSRNSDAGDADAQLETTIAGTRVVVETGPARPDGVLPAVSATVLAPSGTIVTMPLHAVTAERAEAALSLSDTGDYRATITMHDPASGRDTRFVRGWYWSGDLEAQARGVNRPLLQQIASRSGGVVRAGGTRPEAGAGVFDGPRVPASRNAALLLLLVATALLFWDYLRVVSREDLQ
jgi:Ca-activated chloride channel family protein